MFSGTGTALATPFNHDGSIHYEGLERLIDTQLAAGVEALIPCGSTGESATMSNEERLSVIACTIKRARTASGARPVVIAGTGSNVTAATIELSTAAVGAGADGLLLVSPYYNKPTQSGLVAHFGAIAEALPDVPMILYNVPSRTGSNISAATTVMLAHTHNNIVAIKEASGDLEQCAEIIRDAPDGFRVLSGEDTLTVPLMAIGAKGAIAVASNEAPRQFGDMVRAALDGNFIRARELHLSLLELMRANFIESNPIPVKEALYMMGVFQHANYRLPLSPMAEANRTILRDVLRRTGLLPR